jgi:hypothetical protein
VSRRLLAAAALALAASPAGAYVRSNTASGRCLWWSTRSVHYAVNDFTMNAATQVCSSSPAGQVFASVQTSFATWGQATVTGATGPCTDLDLVYDGPTPSTATGLDCQNLVVWRRGLCQDLVPPGDPCRLWSVNTAATVNCADKWNCWDTDDPFHADSRVIALTTVSYAQDSGEIVDADMELNAWAGSGPAPPGYYFTCVDTGGTCGAPGQAGCIAMDVQNVATHEAGHVLGLAHSSVAGSTMEASAPLGETAKRTLAQDDVQGVCAIYPAGQPTRVTCDGTGLLAPRPSSTCEQPSSCGCGTAGAEGWLGLLALLLRRRRNG